jgi:hypothetical protein
LIDNDHYFDCALKYVYRNPVKAKLSNTVEEYEYSTLQNLIKKMPVTIPLSPPIGHASLVPEEGISYFLKWLNQPFPNEQDLAIKGAFKKTRFVPPQEGWMRRKAPLGGIEKSLLE